MRQTHRHTSDDLQRLLHPPPADDLGSECFGLVQEAHQPRFKLVCQKVADRADIEDRRGPLVETRTKHIKQAVSLAHLRPADEHHPLVQPGMDRADDRDDIGR